MAVHQNGDIRIRRDANGGCRTRVSACFDQNRIGFQWSWSIALRRALQIKICNCANLRSQYRQKSTTPLGILKSLGINISLKMRMPNCYDPQSPRRIDETRRSCFLLLGFCSLLRCNNRAAFLLNCSRPCLFLRRLLLRRLWRFVAHMH